MPAIVRRLWLYGRISDLAHVPRRARSTHLRRHQRNHEAADREEFVTRLSFRPSPRSGREPGPATPTEFMDPGSRASRLAGMTERGRAKMTAAFVYDAVRTPPGRGKADAPLHQATSPNLATQALGAIKA